MFFNANSCSSHGNCLCLRFRKMPMMRKMIKDDCVKFLSYKLFQKGWKICIILAMQIDARMAQSLG